MANVIHSIHMQRYENVVHFYFFQISVILHTQPKKNVLFSIYHTFIANIWPSIVVYAVNVFHNKFKYFVGTHENEEFSIQLSVVSCQFSVGQLESFPFHFYKMKWQYFSSIVVILVTLISAFALDTRRPCRLRTTQHGYVCVCDKNYCDSLAVPLPKKNSDYVLVTSSEAGDRFRYENGNFNEPSNSTISNLVLEIDSTIVHQKVWGFGGAHPGATTYLLDQLSSNLRKCFYNSFYSKFGGMGFSRVRFPIGGCDFGLEPWAYNEYPENDSQLSNFTQLDARELRRNQQFKELIRITKNPSVKILAAAWSPPLWMKTNGQWTGKGNAVKEEYYQTWSDYHLKWLELMKNDGMEIWAISPGNEPFFSQTNSLFETTQWEAEKYAKWIAEHFGPMMKNSVFSNVEIHGYDDSRLSAIPWFKNMTKGNEKAFDYFSALSFHGYTDAKSPPDILDEIQSQYPDKSIYYSEMCFRVGSGPQLGNWSTVNDLVDILMKNFNHSMVSYIDWNLILNRTGGPNYAGKMAVTDAPIILSSDYTEMYKQPQFYAMAHFSRFIPPGSIRINAKLTTNHNLDIRALAFLRPDNKITVILYNNCRDQVELTVKDRFKGNFNIGLTPLSINTLIYTVGSRNDPPPTKSSKNINIFIIPNVCCN